jgi:hypothetical protein
MTLNIINPCTKFTYKTLLFLDKWGSYVPFNFYLLKKEFLDIQRSNYRKNYGQSDYTNRWGYNSYDRGLTNIDTSIIERFRVTTDWLTDKDKDILMELFKSREVFLIENNELISINILNTNIENKNIINDMLYNFEVEFEYSKKNRT